MQLPPRNGLTDLSQQLPPHDLSKDTQLINLSISQVTNPEDQGVAQPCNLITQSISFSNIATQALRPCLP